MFNFKTVVSKWQKKFSFIMKAEREAELRERLHKEGYTILSIQKVDSVEITGKTFYFSAYISGELKNGSITGEDIFKCYLKLKDELWYDVKHLYENKDIDDREKDSIIHNLEEHYNIYKVSVKGKKKDVELTNTEKATLEKEKIRKKNTLYAQKELDYTYKLINFILEKFKDIIEWDIYNKMEEEKKEKLKGIYNELINIKNSSNIVKLKNIWELALQKIWEIELEILEQEKSEEYKGLLNDTNDLLKKIWSKTRFIEKDKDIKYKLQRFIRWVDKKIKNKELKTEHSWIDETSYAYIKSIWLIEKYKLKRKENTKNILKNLPIVLFPFGQNKEKVEEIITKRKVIIQNIDILEAKINQKSFSYTKVSRWYSYIVDKISSTIEMVKQPLLLIVFIYSISFILYYSFLTMINSPIIINLNWLNYFLLLLIIYILLSLSKWLITLSINFIVFSFILVFTIINFS